MYDLRSSDDDGRTWNYHGTFTSLDAAKDAADDAWGIVHELVAVFDCATGHEVYSVPESPGRRDELPRWPRLING